MVDLGYQPSLTTEKAVDIIATHFGYKADKKGLYNVVVKNSLLAAPIKVNQFEKEKTTKLYIEGAFSKTWLDILWIFLCLFTGVGCIAWIVISVMQISFKNEIIEFVKNSPEFYPDTKPQ